MRLLKSPLYQVNVDNYDAESKRIFILILLIVPIGQLAIDIYLPSLPSMALYFHISNSMMRWSLTVYLLGFGSSQIIYGQLADKFGRKVILCFGLSVYLLGSLICAFSHFASIFLMARLIQGVGIGCGPVVTKAMAGDVFSGTKLTKTALYMTISWALTPIIAPAFGGYIQDTLGWQANFLFLTLYAGIVFIFVIIFMPETYQSDNHQKNQIKYLIYENLSVLSNRFFLSYLLLMTTSFALLISFSCLGPFLLQSGLGLTAVLYGRYVLFVGVAYLFGTLLNRYLIDKFDINKLLSFGINFVMVTAISMLIAAIFISMTTLSIMLPTCFIAFGIGFIYPNAMAKALSIFPERRGMTAAILSWIPMLGCSITSALLTQLDTFAQLPLAITFVLLSLSQWLLFALAYRYKLN